MNKLFPFFTSFRECLKSLTRVLVFILHDVAVGFEEHGSTPLYEVFNTKTFAPACEQTSAN